MVRARVRVRIRNIQTDSQGAHRSHDRTSIIIDLCCSAGVPRFRVNGSIKLVPSIVSTSLTTTLTPMGKYKLLTILCYMPCLQLLPLQYRRVRHRHLLSSVSDKGGSSPVPDFLGEDNDSSWGDDSVDVAGETRGKALKEVRMLTAAWDLSLMTFLLLTFNYVYGRHSGPIRRVPSTVMVDSNTTRVRMEGRCIASDQVC